MENVTISLDVGDPQHTTPVTQSTGEKVWCFFRTNYGFVSPPPVDQGPPLPTDEIPWVDDALPAGAVEDATAEEWWWTSVILPRAGRAAHVSQPKDGMHEQAFTGATAKMRVGPGDILFAYVRLNPSKPPREVMLQWHDDSWEHRALWGEDLIAAGTGGSASRIIVVNGARGPYLRAVPDRSTANNLRSPPGC